MRKNENKTSKFVCIVLLLCVVAMILVAGTYAKYVSTASGSAEAVVAGWEIVVEEKTLGVNNTDLTFDLFGGKTMVAPGSKGSVVIPVENNSDVNATFGVDFTVSGTDLPIKYSFEENGEYTDDLTDLAGKTIAKGAAENVTIYWKWVTPAENGDAADTAVGVAAATTETKVTVDAVITVSQAD